MASDQARSFERARISTRPPDLTRLRPAGDVLVVARDAGGRLLMYGHKGSSTSTSNPRAVAAAKASGSCHRPLPAGLSPPHLHVPQGLSSPRATASDPAWHQAVLSGPPSPATHSARPSGGTTPAPPLLLVHPPLLPLTLANRSLLTAALAMAPQQQGQQPRKRRRDSPSGQPAKAGGSHSPLVPATALAEASTGRG